MLFSLSVKVIFFIQAAFFAAKADAACKCKDVCSSYRSLNLNDCWLKAKTCPSLFCQTFFAKQENVAALLADLLTVM
jgi:hypothetical protein